MAPLIGVTTSEVRRGDLATLRRHGEPPQHEMALGLTYLRAVELAGGVPVVLPPLAPDAAGDAARRASTASASPAAPTSTPPPTAPARHEQLGPTEPRARPLRARARARRRRARACRCSASAAAPRRSTSRAAARCTSTSTDHRQTELATQPVHAVRIAAALARSRGCIGARAARGQLLPPPGGRRARRRARAPPRGRPTARSRRSRTARHPFLLGVQWHAETLVDDPAQLALFRALVDAASGRARCPVRWLREPEIVEQIAISPDRAALPAPVPSVRAEAGRGIEGEYHWSDDARARPEPHADRRRGARGPARGHRHRALPRGVAPQRAHARHRPQRARRPPLPVGGVECEGVELCEPCNTPREADRARRAARPRPPRRPARRHPHGWRDRGRRPGGRA